MTGSLTKNFAIQNSPALSFLCQHGLQTAKCSSTSSVIRNLPLSSLSEDELMMKETVSKFASQTIAPYVKQMDNQQCFDPKVVEALFSHGVCLFSENLFIVSLNDELYIVDGP